MSEMSERRPFHETIVKAITTAHNSEVLYILAWLIKATIIPANHDQIAAAWKERLGAYRD